MRSFYTENIIKDTAIFKQTFRTDLEENLVIQAHQFVLRNPHCTTEQAYWMAKNIKENLTNCGYVRINRLTFSYLYDK